MEIFMHNMAYSVTHTDIVIALAERLHRPPFPDDPINFHVNLFYKKKGCGIITLPTEESGSIFLNMYGVAGLPFKGRQIMFKRSTHDTNQGRVLYLRSHPWNDPKALQEEKTRTEKLSEPIPVKDFSFGRFSWDGTFFAQSDGASVKAEIACDLENRQVTLTVNWDVGGESQIAGKSSSESVFSPLFDISFDNISFENLFSTKSKTTSASYSPPQVKDLFYVDHFYNVPRVFLVSYTPPIFVSPTSNPLSIITGDKTTSQRRPSLGKQSMLPMCHSLSLTFYSQNDRDTFLIRCEKLRLPEAKARGNVSYRTQDSSTQLLTQLDSLLEKLTFELAFEVEKAFYMGTLEPAEILLMEEELVRLSMDTRVEPAAVFRFFLTTRRPQETQGFTTRRKRKRKRGRKGQSRPEEVPPKSLGTQLRDAMDSYLEDQEGAQSSGPRSEAFFYSYYLIITPTSRILEGPLPDQSNSVLRRFGHHECFLRVSIQDESKAKFRKDPNIDPANILKTRFRPLLVDGLRLAGRKYEFLGYSMSGLKEHSVWFVTPFQTSPEVTMDAKSIRDKLVSMACPFHP